ncbi:MAG: dienelactone hydrolase family protein [Betaproteobacteria bacterium]|nr:dienelactone hydrolase family protein [Betaproteobacteria bacterium]
MKEKRIDIPTASGAMETFITHPRGSGPFPAVIIYMDVWGVREELFDIARRIATVGYYCAVPDLYYRQGKIRHEFRNEKNQMITLERLDEHKKEIVRGPLRQLSDAMVVDDTGWILEFFERGEPVRPGGVGCIGYCMGGRHVFRVAGRFPDRFKACASMHGTNLVTDQDDSPHLSAKKAQGELYCGFGEKDRFASVSTIRTLEETLRDGPVRYRYEVHQGAEHGYALPDRDVHDKQAANRDWELIFAMFRRQIPPYAE